MHERERDTSILPLPAQVTCNNAVRNNMTRPRLNSPKHRALRQAELTALFGRAYRLLPDARLCIAKVLKALPASDRARGGIHSSPWRCVPAQQPTPRGTAATYCRSTHLSTFSCTVQCDRLTGVEAARLLADSPYTQQPAACTARGTMATV